MAGIVDMNTEKSSVVHLFSNRTKKACKNGTLSAGFAQVSLVLSMIRAPLWVKPLSSISWFTTQLTGQILNTVQSSFKAARRKKS